MNKSNKTKQQLLLDVSQQRLQEANERMQAEIKERTRTEQVLAERLKFETLLAEISARFVNVPADLIDGEIEAAQRRICESLDLDLMAVWQLSNEAPVVLTATHY
jgi:hypothetical protein